MALIRALNSAISGLRGHQIRIDGIGNNLANVNTVAYKSGRTLFQATFAQTLSQGSASSAITGGINPQQLGLGVEVGAISQNFAQGAFDTTGIASDLGVEGDGFFVLNDAEGSPLYTRDGSFRRNIDNLLVNPANGFRVQGWQAQYVTDPQTMDFTLNPGGALTDIEIPVGELAIAKATSLVNIIGNLNPDDATATSGTRTQSQQLFDRTTGAEAGPATNLTNVSTTAGVGGPRLIDGTAADDTIVVTAQKGGRALNTMTFRYGVGLDGTTVRDFAAWMEDKIGIHTSVSPTAPSSRSVGTADAGSTTTSLVDVGNTWVADGVAVGDIVRFVSGTAAGASGVVTAVGATLTISAAQPFHVAPAAGDEYEIVRPTGATPLIGHTRFSGGATGGTTTTLVDASEAWAAGRVTVGDFVRFNTGNLAGTIAQVSRVDPTTDTITFTSALSAAPTAGSQYSVFAPAGVTVHTNSGVVSSDHTIDISGNIGTGNRIENIVVKNEAGSAILTFTQVAAAAGNSAHSSFLAYDSLGVGHRVDFTLVEEQVSNTTTTWRYYGDSQDDTSGGQAIADGTITFDVNGQYSTTAPMTNQFAIDLQAQGVTTQLIFSADFSSMSQLSNGPSDVNLRSQDGFARGVLEAFGVGVDGIVKGTFTNGLTRKIAQVALARFSNNNGLLQEGDTNYRIGVNSGAAQIGVAGTDGRGLIRGGGLEESNVDVAREFTDLIVTQRGFQANARVIGVADEMLNELVNLKR